MKLQFLIGACLLALSAFSQTPPTISTIGSSNVLTNNNGGTCFNTYFAVPNTTQIIYPNIRTIGRLCFVGGRFQINIGYSWHGIVTDSLLGVQLSALPVPANYAAGFGMLKSGSSPTYTLAIDQTSIMTVSRAADSINAIMSVVVQKAPLSALDGFYTKTQSNVLFEPVFGKMSAFNKNFGSVSGTVAEGNDARINNGQTAFGWGPHAGLYPLYNGTGATGTWNLSITGNSATTTKLFTARTINSQSFDGTANITIPGSAISGIPNSSLTNSAITINGTPVSLGGSTTVSSSPTISAPSAGNSITMATAFQPRLAGPCMVLVNGSITGALGLNETVTVAISPTQTGTYTAIASDVLLIGLLGLTLDRSVASFPVPTGYWVKVTRTGTAASATYTKWDL